MKTTFAVATLTSTLASAAYIDQLAGLGNMTEVLSQVNLLSELTSKELADKTIEDGEYTYTYHKIKRTWEDAE